MKTILNLLIFTMTIMGFGQNTYLKISEDEKMSVSYPPGTSFELKNKHGYIVLKSSEKPLVYDIDEPHTLTVFPTYTSGKDVYKLTSGKIEIVSNQHYMNYIQHHKSSYQSYGVTLEDAQFTNSQINTNTTNVKLQFSNGVMFDYTDGKVYATQGDTSLDIKGKYLVYTSEGVLKISYNPNNSELWWAYEPN